MNSRTPRRTWILCFALLGLLVLVAAALQKGADPASGPVNSPPTHAGTVSGQVVWEDRTLLATLVSGATGGYQITSFREPERHEAELAWDYDNGRGLSTLQWSAAMFVYANASTLRFDGIDVGFVDSCRTGPGPNDSSQCAPRRINDGLAWGSTTRSHDSTTFILRAVGGPVDVTSNLTMTFSSAPIPGPSHTGNASWAYAPVTFNNESGMTASAKLDVETRSFVWARAVGDDAWVTNVTAESDHATPISFQDVDDWYHRNDGVSFGAPVLELSRGTWNLTFEARAPARPAGIAYIMFEDVPDWFPLP